MDEEVYALSDWPKSPLTTRRAQEFHRRRIVLMKSFTGSQKRPDNMEKVTSTLARGSKRG